MDRKKAARAAAFSWNSTCSYFGGGVVLPPLFFLLFFPPLWAFLAVVLAGGVVLCEVAFLPGGSGCGFNELLSPPVCAKAKPAPRTKVITNVETFFIQFLHIRFLLRVLSRVNP
jgi:hypothetical protein